jgi:hypothetical protein
VAQAAAAVGSSISISSSPQLQSQGSFAVQNLQHQSCSSAWLLQMVHLHATARNPAQVILDSTYTIAVHSLSSAGS